MFLLQLCSALLLFLNKYFVLKGKAIGWIYGALGAAVITIYFYLQMVFEHKSHLWIMVVFDIALIVNMMYGYFMASSIEGSVTQDFLKKWNIPIKAVVLIVSLSVCLMLLIQALSAHLVINQFFFAVASLFGTLLLAFRKKVTNIIGWGLYFIGHCIITDVMFKTGSPVIAVFQIISGGVALWAIRKELKKK